MDTSFSVIIPTYNRAETLRRALKSLTAQTYKSFEVIVCDDGSTDHTEEVSNSFKGDLDIRYLWEENWGGPARPRNRGIKAAHGEWVCFLDSDDWWYPDKLEVTQKYLEKADVLYHDMDMYSSKGKRFVNRHKRRHLHKPVFEDLLVNANTLPNSGVTARRSIIEQAGGLAEDKLLVAYEDYDLWIRISRLTDRFIYIPRSLGAYVAEEGIYSIGQKGIASVEYLYKQYLDLLPDEPKKQAEMQMLYQIGRAKQKSGRVREALDLFKKSSKARNRSVKWKSRYLASAIYLGFIR